MIGPVSEIRTLVFDVFGSDKRRIVESDEPILICITDHAAIPFMENFSLTLQMEFDGRMDVGRDLVIIYVFSFLIVIFTSINLFRRAPVIKCTVEGWDVALGELTIVTAIQVVMVLWRYMTRSLAALAMSVNCVVSQFCRVHGAYHS